MPRSGRESGFTLIEVALSVAILGVALTTLVALQSGYLRSYMYGRNLVKASLVGQYLLAVWDADEDLPNPGSSEKDLLPILDKLGYFAESDTMIDEKISFEGWQLRRTVTNVGYPPLEKALRKIELEVIWGPGSNERFPLVYFAKGDQMPGGDGDAEVEEDISEDEPSGETGGEAQD